MALAHCPATPTEEGPLASDTRPSRRDQSPDQEAEVAIDLASEDALQVLRDREITGGQRIPWSSNHTFLVHIDAGPGKYLRAIYKPRDGERPLYDFPAGSLYKREYAQIPHLRLLGWLLWAYSRCGVSTGVLIGLCAASLRGLATVSRQLWSLSG